MEHKNEWLERIFAVSLVVLGCLIDKSIIIAVGIIYFIAKM